MSTRKLFINVDDPAGSIDFQVSVDCRYFDADDMQSVVRGIEAAAVETALDPDAPTRVGPRQASGVAICISGNAGLFGNDCEPDTNLLLVNRWLMARVSVNSRSRDSASADDLMRLAHPTLFASMLVQT